jgi:Something about silencing, SAS, complex subunit 4
MLLISPDFLNADTPIVIIDTNPPAGKQNQPNSPKTRHSNGHAPRPRIRQFPDALFNDLYQSQKVDFAFLDKHCKVNPREDPLSDAYYDAAHKKAERLERSIRNSEKGRAQHEKDQVIRLLEGLQGHDWLKVMGVTGITESKKKDYAPARDYFIKGCLAIIEKFRTWREEEKRRKLEKEKALAEAEEEEVGEDEGETSDGDPPDYSDVDHAAARQLHQEAIARSAPLASSKATEKRVKVEPKIPSMEDLEKEFRSFYSKRHQREAAIGKHRRSGRLAVAWGQPVPELQEQDFELPDELRNKETLEANARRKRRDRRVSKE